MIQGVIMLQVFVKNVVKSLNYLEAIGIEVGVIFAPTGVILHIEALRP